MTNPAYPNGRCPVCGQGLTDEGACQNEECQEYGWFIPEEERD